MCHTLNIKHETLNIMEELEVRSYYKKELRAMVGAPRRTFTRWISLHQPALTAMGVGPKARLLPPWAVKYLSKELDIDLPKRKIIKVKP